MDVQLKSMNPNILGMFLASLEKKWPYFVLLCTLSHFIAFYSTHYTRGQRRKVPTTLYITLKPSDICSVVFTTVQEDISNSVLL